MSSELINLEKQEQTALEKLYAAKVEMKAARKKVFDYVLANREWHLLSELKKYAGEQVSELAAVVQYSNVKEEIIVWEHDYDKAWLKIEDDRRLHIIEIESRDDWGTADEYEEYYYDLDSGEERSKDGMKIIGFVWVQLFKDKERRGYAGIEL